MIWTVVDTLVQFPKRLSRALRVAVIIVAAASPLTTHLAVTTGHGLGVAMSLATVQGIVAATALPGLLGREWRRWMPLLVLVLVAWSAGRVLGHGLLAAAGLSHLLLFGGLLVLFGATLRPGRMPLAEQFARRLDPNFHEGMIGYARAVTLAWCALFAGQILVSLGLLLFAPASVWSLFINVLDLACVAAMFLGETLIRRLRFPRQGHVPLRQLVGAVRAGGLGR